MRQEPVDDVAERLHLSWVPAGLLALGVDLVVVDHLLLGRDPVHQDGQRVFVEV